MNSTHTSSDSSEYFSAQDFEKYKSWISFYAKKNDIQVQINPNFDGIAAINLGNLRRPIIILNPLAITKKYKCSSEDIMFFLFHEIEHYKEAIDLEQTKNGSHILEERLQRFEEKGSDAKAFHTLENALRDVFVNTEVVATKNAPILKDVVKQNYKTRLFPSTNYISLPLHVQFYSTLLRESMLPGEKCEIDPRVRREIDSLHAARIHPTLIAGSLGNRLRAIWKYAEPIYEEFLREDTEKEEKKRLDSEKNKPSSNDGGKSETSSGGPKKNQNTPEKKDSKAGSKENPTAQPGGPKNPETQKGGIRGIISRIKKAIHDITNRDESSKPAGEKSQGEKQDDTHNSSQDIHDNTSSSESSKNISTEQTDISRKETIPPEEDNLPKNPFDEYYEDHIPHFLGDSIDSESLDKFKKTLAQGMSQNQREFEEREMEMQKRLENLGINPENTEIYEQTRKMLEEYDRFLQKLESIKDPELNESLISEIENIFSQIISKRKKPRFHSRGPVDMEEGDGLFGASLAEGYASIRARNHSPEMFEKIDVRLKEHCFVGNIDISIIADGSISMGGVKNREQKIAFLLIFEGLKRLHERMSENRHLAQEGLDIRTQGLLFDGKQVISIKPLSEEMTDKDRLIAYRALDICNGGTNDYDAIATIKSQINDAGDDYMRDLASGKKKHIVIVTTDGESGNAKKLQESLSALRDLNVIVYGIGITEAGKSVVESYAPTEQHDNLGHGEICPHSEDLAIVLKSILKQHLSEI